MSTKTRLWVLGTAVLCAGLILFGLAAGLMPQLATAASTNQSVENQQMLNDLQRARLAQLQTARQNSAELESQLNELQAAIPGAGASVEWLEELRGIEAQTGALVKNYEVLALPSQQTEPDAAQGGDPAEAEAEARAPGAQVISVTLEVVVDEKAAVAAFVRQVQEGSRLFLISSVEIVEEPSSTPPWRAKVEGTLYAWLG